MQDIKPQVPVFDPETIARQATGTDKIRTVMAALRDPDRGCPWDLEQTFETIAPYAIEEAYEVRDAIASGNRDDFREELGDLLLQVVYQSQLAVEQNLFDFDAVAETVAEKMIRRHPHVFATPDGRTTKMQRGAWEAQKAVERKQKAESGAIPSALDGVLTALPALMRANKLQDRAARVGFDWPDAGGVYEKLDEELAELKAAGTPAETEEEIGDLLFTAVNLSRKLNVDPEEALRKSSDKFETRFRRMEKKAAEDRSGPLRNLSPDALETLWQEAKTALANPEQTA